jgi:hypothetical protein
VRVSLSARSRLPCSGKAAPISGYEVHEPWGLCWATTSGSGVQLIGISVLWVIGLYVVVKEDIEFATLILIDELSDSWINNGIYMLLHMV